MSNFINLSNFVKKYIVPKELQNTIIEVYYTERLHNSIINRLDHETWEILLYSNLVFSPIVDVSHDKLMDHLSDELVDSDAVKEFIEVIKRDKILTIDEINSIKFGRL